MNTILLLIASNVFMTVAWYWHLKGQGPVWPLWAIILTSWAIALPEYCLAIPANRIGHLSHGGPFSAPQLKIIQEGISLTIFLVFSILVLKEHPRWQDYAGMVLIFAGVALALSGRPAK